MFGTLGGQEIILILIVGLIVFGPRKLPEIGKTVGKMLAEFRKASSDFKRTIEDEVEAEKVPLPPAAPAPEGIAGDPAIEPVAMPPDTPTVSRLESEGVVDRPAEMETPSRLEPPALAEADPEPVETKPH